MGGYAYAADNPATSSDPTGQCPVDLCGAGIVNNDFGINGATVPYTPARPAAGPTPCTLDCNYNLSPGQYQYMQHLGYRGPKDAVTKDIINWLSNDIPVHYREEGWGYFCQGLAGMSTSQCASDPITGNKNIYDSGIGVKSFTAIAVVFTLTAGAAIACAAGVCEAIGTAAGASEFMSLFIGQTVIGGISGFANSAIQGGTADEVGTATVEGVLSGMVAGPIAAVVNASEASAAMKVLIGTGTAMAGRVAVLAWLDSQPGAQGPSPSDLGGQATDSAREAGIDAVPDAFEWVEFWNNYRSVVGADGGD
jgi:hypothetical protein